MGLFPVNVKDIKIGCVQRVRKNEYHVDITLTRYDHFGMKYKDSSYRFSRVDDNGVKWFRYGTKIRAFTYPLVWGYRDVLTTEVEERFQDRLRKQKINSIINKTT